MAGHEEVEPALPEEGVQGRHGAYCSTPAVFLFDLQLSRAAGSVVQHPLALGACFPSLLCQATAVSFCTVCEVRFQLHALLLLPSTAGMPRPNPPHHLLHRCLSSGAGGRPADPLRLLLQVCGHQHRRAAAVPVSRAGACWLHLWANLLLVGYACGLAWCLLVAPVG